MQGVPDASAPDSRTTPPAAVLEAWGLAVEGSRPLAGGLMNASWLVHDQGGRRYVLQRLHPVFEERVNLDVEAVTEHLAARELTTPRLVRTRRGEAWTEHEGRPWRLLTYVEGRTEHVVRSAAMAEAAGTLLGRFHHALRDYARPMAFERPEFHDTPRYLRRLAEAVDRHREHPDWDEVAPLAEAILREAERLPSLQSLPRRMIHGDPKIGNVRFAKHGPRAVAMVDLDTVGRAPLAVELGDALRSWCNPAREDAEGARVDEAFFEAALRGWARGGGRAVSDAEERATFVTGLRVI